MRERHENSRPAFIELLVSVLMTFWWLFTSKSNFKELWNLRKTWLWSLKSLETAGKREWDQGEDSLTICLIQKDSQTNFLNSWVKIEQCLGCFEPD